MKQLLYYLAFTCILSTTLYSSSSPAKRPKDGEEFVSLAADQQERDLIEDIADKLRHLRLRIGQNRKEGHQEKRKREESVRCEDCGITHEGEDTYHKIVFEKIENGEKNTFYECLKT